MVAGLPPSAADLLSIRNGWVELCRPGIHAEQVHAWGMALKRAITEAIWEWLPGVVAGWLPFMMFLIGAPFADRHTPKLALEVSQHLTSGMTVHMLILGITNSTVSIVMAFWKLYSMELPQYLRSARRPVASVMISLAILLYQTSLYAWQEWGPTGPAMIWIAGVGLFSSLVISLYLEFSVASLRARARVAVHAGTNP